MNGPENANIIIEPLSGSVIRLEMLFQDLVVAVGTGFLWEEAGRSCIVTAWHNVTGTHPTTGKSLSKTGARPDAYRAHLLGTQLGQHCQYTGKLYADDGTPLYRSHPTYGRRVDAVALDVTGPLPAAATICKALNQFTWQPIQLRVGASAFVIGFPRGLSMSGLPIWKRGTIASEPALVSFGTGATTYLLDAATREGMSGAPVILLSDGSYQDERSNMIMNGTRAQRFLGLYSGRVASSDQMEAQLGLVWPANLIQEVATLGAYDDFRIDQ